MKQLKLTLEEYEALLQQYKTILRSVNAGTWTWNIQTGETIFDERWAEIIGYTLDEIDPNSIETWIEFTHPDDFKQVQNLLNRYFAGETVFYEFEARMRHKNGNWIWVLDRGQLIERDNFGKPLLMVGSHIDITALKELEREKRESQYHELIDNAPFPVIISRISNQKILYGNKRARLQFGLKESEKIGLFTPNVYVNSKDRDFFLHQLNSVGYVYDFEVELYNFCQQPYWALMTASFITYDDELSVLTTINDISLRKQGEEDLRIEKEKYQFLTESMADVVWVFNVQKMSFIYFSSSIFSLSGYTVDEAMSLRFDGIFMPDSMQELLNDFGIHLKEFSSSPEIFTNFIHESKLIRKDGTTIWVELSSKFRFNNLKK